MAVHNDIPTSFRRTHRERDQLPPNSHRFCAFPQVVQGERFEITSLLTLPNIMKDMANVT